MPHWILQKNLTKPQVLERIKNTLSINKDSWQEILVIPFSEQLPPLTVPDGKLVFYGSTTLMLNAYKDLNYRDGVFYNPESFQMANYVTKWGDNVLNCKGLLMELRNFTHLDSPLEKKWFVRPNNDGKEFSGRVDTYKSLKDWANRICQLDAPDLNKFTEIWVAQPAIINKEWRLFIVDDELISTCRYMKAGKLNINKDDKPAAMLSFAKNRINEYRPDDVYVMDIAEVNGEFKLIECNCFNGTGFYDHDIEKIVSAINNFLKRQNN